MSFIAMAMAAAAMQASAALPVQEPTSVEKPARGPGVIGEPAGSGRYPAVAEVDAGLTTHTIYHPVNPPAQRMPILVWGNGGCLDNGLSASRVLRELASHGYFVIAAGRARAESPPRRTLAQQPMPAWTTTGPLPPPGHDETTTRTLIAGLDWAIAENGRRGSRWFGKLDPTRVATLGHSCGGIEAIEGAPDPRVKTSVIFASGVYNRGPERIGVSPDRRVLDKLHAPIVYINGGPTDVAFAGGVVDVGLIRTVPLFFGWTSIGHLGTFGEPNGGEWAKIGVAWLDWRLRGDKAAARYFVGANCSLCTRPDWNVVRNAKFDQMTAR